MGCKGTEFFDNCKNGENFFLPKSIIVKYADYVSVEFCVAGNEVSNLKNGN